MWRRIFLLTPFIILLLACNAVGQDEPVTPRAESIVCHAAYRGTAGGAIEREETLTLADADGTRSLKFAELEIRAFYSTGASDNERALRLVVTPPGGEAPITTQLYQLPVDSGPTNQFIGGHGFTGLTYAYSAEGAELQFWCTAA